MKTVETKCRCGRAMTVEVDESTDPKLVNKLLGFVRCDTCKNKYRTYGVKSKPAAMEK